MQFLPYGDRIAFVSKQIARCTLRPFWWEKINILISLITESTVHAVYKRKKNEAMQM